MLRVAALCALFLVCFNGDRCDKIEQIAPTVPAVAGAVAFGADEARREVGYAREDGTLSAEEAEVADDILEELGATAVELRDSKESVNWHNLSAADRRELARITFRRTGPVLDKLEKHAQRIKNPDRRRQMLDRVRNARRAVAVLKILDVVVPTPQRPSPTPAPPPQ